MKTVKSCCYTFMCVIHVSAADSEPVNMNVNCRGDERLVGAERRSWGFTCWQREQEVTLTRCFSCCVWVRDSELHNCVLLFRWLGFPLWVDLTCWLTLGLSLRPEAGRNFSRVTSTRRTPRWAPWLDESLGKARELARRQRGKYKVTVPVSAWDSERRHGGGRSPADRYALQPRWASFMLFKG